MNEPVRAYDPPKPEDLETISLAEFLGRVVAGFNAKQGEERETGYGLQTPLILSPFVIFDLKGNPEVIRDDHFLWQKKLQSQFLQSKGTLYGRLAKDGQAYVLEPLEQPKYDRVHQIALERGWLQQTGQGSVSRQEVDEAF